MRDSWIDRDELDELVGSFSSVRKGKGRRVPARAKSSKESEAKPGDGPVSMASDAGIPPEPFSSEPESLAVEPESLANEPESLANEPDSVEGMVEAEAEAEVPVSADFPEIEPSMNENPDAVLDIFELDDDSGDGDEPGWGLSHDEAPEVDFILVEVEETAEAIMSPVEGPIDEGDGEPAAEIEAAVGVDEETPPPLIDLPPRDWLTEDGAMETGVPESHEPEVVVSTVPEEELLRELPLFLDDADDFVPRIPTLSERDADRALIALAEARARAEQGGLLRNHRAPVEEVMEVETDSPDEVREKEPEIEPILDEPTSVAPGDESGPEEPNGTLSDRIERFVVMARSELGATAAAISDRDGFLLFTQSDCEGDEAMETAFLLEVAGKADRLLGVEHGSATQVSTDGGAWRCLIRGGDGAGDLYAGFRLQRPLDQEEIVRWRNALADIISPTPELR